MKSAIAGRRIIGAVVTVLLFGCGGRSAGVHREIKKNDRVVQQRVKTLAPRLAKSFEGVYRGMLRNATMRLKLEGKHEQAFMRSQAAVKIADEDFKRFLKEFDHFAIQKKIKLEQERRKMESELTRDDILLRKKPQEEKGKAEPKPEKKSD